MPASAWGPFEAEAGGSCGTPVCVRWRASKQVGRCEPFDDVHRSAAERALRKGLWSANLESLGWWIGCALEQTEAEG